MQINEVSSYEQAVTMRRQDPKCRVHALCPTCNVEQICFVDMPESSERPEVACMECMTPIFTPAR